MAYAMAQETIVASERPGDAEEQLITRIAAGDRHALAALYHAHRQPLFAYLLHLTGDRELAEEVLQDTFLAVWHGAGRFAGRARVRTWLIGIARRQAHTTLRRRALPRADLQDAADLADAAPDPADRAIAAATGDELRATLEKLPAAIRETLLLAFAHGLSYAEIADVLGVPVGTVKSRLHTAKRAMRALLERAREETA